ncbi:hypothetical protein [Ruixingdingia sedimenti]|uniref:Uncharacterized protein n=1 Tax=Ruixingdingia sedimenti TaxID=3073604 RepID=A0ABU1FEX5_9RHOB|nr:hypothetical protein [Xinfangfangia sp. LG-4]MDR5655118.1 hypothetical protein [Xinfangfangia sp. LG-4]
MRPIPDIEAFEERAAVMEHDGGLSRSRAEDRAAQAQGFRDAAEYWQVLADYVVTKRLGGQADG